MITATISDYVACQDDFYFRKLPVSPQGIIRTGQKIELECRVSAEDRISISWTLDGELLLNSSRRYQNDTTGDLIIRRADHRLDSGAFACTATNISSGFSIASQSATLLIQCKRTVSNPFSPYNSKITYSANMVWGDFYDDCKSVNFPSPRPHIHDRHPRHEALAHAAEVLLLTLSSSPLFFRSVSSISLSLTSALLYIHFYDLQPPTAPFYSFLSLMTIPERAQDTIPLSRSFCSFPQ